jgi:putative ABC transport system permease protein
MFKIAFRNFLANKRRTLFTLSSIAAGGAGLLLALGFMMATFHGLAANFISEEGHLQIFHRGYFNDNDIVTGAVSKIANPMDLIREIESWDHVDVVTARIAFSGVIGNEYQSQTMIGEAIIPEKENKIGLGGFFAPLVKGTRLTSRQKDGCYIGEGLAKKLKVKPGDYLSILTNTVEGSYNSASVKVLGIVKYGVEEYNQSKVAVNLELANLLIHSKGADRLVLRLDDDNSIQTIKARLNQYFKNQQLPYIVKDWEELSPYYRAVKGLYTRIFAFLLILIIFIMILSIVNNVMMTVYERFREIGIMRAIGTNQIKVGKIFMYESVLLGISGWFLAVGIALGVKMMIERVGIIMPPAPGRTYAYPLSFMIDHSFYIYVFIVCFLAALIGSIFPVLKSGKIKIIEALKYV